VADFRAERQPESLTCPNRSAVVSIPGNAAYATSLERRPKESTIQRLDWKILAFLHGPHEGSCFGICYVDDPRRDRGHRHWQ
jgi:hypothetical protein